MPRTKQNNPKNLKDKIEEAQNELKDTKAGAQKGINEGGRRSADNIKALKRKKVVKENQLKKIPKSPVKKSLQSKTSVATLQAASSKEAAPSCSYPNSPSQNPASSPSQNRDTEYVQPNAESSEGVTSSIDNDRLKQRDTSFSKPQSLDPISGKEESVSGVGESQQLKDSKSDETSCEGDSPYHASAPLEVLLRAMESDFSSLSEKKKSFPVTAIEKPGRTLSAQSNSEVNAMTAIHFGLQTQPAHMQNDFVNKQETYTMHSSTQAVPLQTLQHATQHFSNCGEKPGLQMSFSTGSSDTLTHSPVPSGSNSLPRSQPPVVHTCQSLSASVPSTIQVPVTPGYNPVQMATVVNFGLEQMCSISAKDQKPKKQGKYVCEYCSRACAKPSVLLKHIRSHTGERPYPCVTCGFSFKTKSNLYKHKKSHAHAIKLGLVARSDSGSGSLSVESDKALGTHSDVEESGDSDEESSTADLDPDSSQSSVAAFSESSLLSAGTTQGNHGDAGDPSAVFPLSQRGYESKGTASLPKVVVYPVNVSPQRADSPRVTDSSPEQATAQRQKDFQTAHLRSSITVLSSVKEVDCTSPLQDAGSEDEDQQCRTPPGGGHGQLQRQQATDFSQQQQGKCLLSPRSLGSTDSGYFSRSESADQAMSPPSPFVKITPPTDMDVTKNALPNLPAVVATAMHVASVEKPRVVQGQMRPPLETKALSLEERISKLISDNEAVVDDKQLDSVKPRRTSLSRRGSIDSPKSYIFKDSFQFDLKPMARRSSSSSDIPKSPFTPTEKSKPVFLLSVPNQYTPMDCLPITRSNSMPTTPGHSGLPPNIVQQPHPLRICQSFDDKMSSLNDDVFSSAPSTPNPAIHSRTLVRQVAVEDFSTSEGLTSVRSMDEGYHGSSISTELMQRSRSFEHAQDRNRKPLQSKGTMYECETCRNRYRKLENFENHKKFYCSELHGPKNKPVSVRETEQDVFQHVMQQPLVPRTVISGIMDQQQSFRKRRKMKSVGDDDDQSPTDTNPPCSVSFDSCQLSTASSGRPFSQHSIMVDLQPKSNPPQITQNQLVARGTDASESRLSPIRETQVNTSGKERGDLQRQGSGTSVIRHTNSLSKPNSFETSESIDRTSPVDFMYNDGHSTGKTKTDATANLSLESYHEKMSIPKCADQGKQGMENRVDSTLAAVAESCAAVQQSRLVRQNNIPEILVTEEPDREHDGQSTEQGEKVADTFNWPQRSESLSKLPTEKLPPKKKRIRLAQMEHSSGESSFESSLSRSLSRDSSLSRCSSISASFDRDEPSRSESPSRGEFVNKISEHQGLPIAFNTLGVPGMIRRAASEQISCTQPSVEILCDYRSKSFDFGSVSPSRSLPPNRSMSPMELPTSAQAFPSVQVPLIERRRGPLVRQMSLKIGPESQQHVGRHAIPLQRLPTVFSTSQQRPQQTTNKPPLAQPFIVHSGETLPQKNERMVQSINLGSQGQLPQIHGLPHPWHLTSRVQTCQNIQQSVVHVVVGQEDAQNNSADSQDKSFVPKYQLQCPALRPSQTYSLSTTQGTQTTLPVLTIPIANQMQSILKSSDVLHNVCVAQPCFQIVSNKTQSIVLPVSLQNDPPSQNLPGALQLPQILITHEQMHPSLSVTSNLYVVDTDRKTVPEMNKDRLPASTSLQVKHGLVSNTQNHIGEIQKAPSLGSLHCTQKMAAVTLCPQQEPIASSKRMLSPANSLDIAMEKHQKRAKDEHGAACLTDGRSVNYLNSKMAEVTRQRKLMLVRQVCTTEPVDSPIETEAPPLQHEKPVGEKDAQTPKNCKTMTPESTGKDEPSSVVPQEQPRSALNTAPGSHVSSSVPANASLKPQDKSEEERWSPAKSPIRPSTFHGQVKLASSVSVVNTRDSHRLSFPSLKTATTFTWCYLMKRRPLHVPQTDQKVSAYSTWAVSPNNPNPLGLPTKVVMSLFDSKQNSKKIHYTEAITTSMKSDILAYSSKLKDVMPKVLMPQKTENNSKVQPESQVSSESDKDSSSSKIEPRRVKIFDGGFKSNEDYVYVRGRGRGKYICEECGIRCKKPSMLRKHIRTHSDVRPYHCTHCNFSFKTKGNLTKHMKSKAHSKKCMEMGVSAGLEDHDTEDSGDHSQVGSTDRPDSDGEDSEGADDDNDDDNEEEEEDSQAESGLSTNPSVSASPQHIPSSLQAELPPSSLLAQMSIHHHHPAPLSLPQLPASDSHTHHTHHASDTESVPMLSPVSLVKQMSISGGCSSPGPLPYSPPPHTSDTESVHMMSPVSPCRQMSIDYPDVDVPPSPPVPGKGCFKLGQDDSLAPPTLPTSEPGVPFGTDVSTQTASFTPQTSSYSPWHFPSQGPTQGSGATQGGHMHLFSHLPLHSQQPSCSSYSMVPVGGIQLVPAGLPAYSTFVPIQAGTVQLTIPAVSVIHRNTSPLPFPKFSNSPQPEGSALTPTNQPLVVQEPISSIMPCFPLGQVTGLQALGASQQTLQSMGLETLNVMGLTSSGGLTSTQLLSQHGLTLNATMGLQALTASPSSQSSTGPHHHHTHHTPIPGLQILNIALPALIPSLSPLSALSPLPGPSERKGSPEAQGATRLSSQTELGPLVSCPSAASSLPTATMRGSPAQEMTSSGSRPSSSGHRSSGGSDHTQTPGKEGRVITSLPQPSPAPAAEGVVERAGGASEPVMPRRQSMLSRQQVTEDFIDDSASSDDEDRLVIAT
ncbi:zinc finger protein 40 isoform X1 [Oncorhynchus mykiss]|uniref:Zinc finger protein 40 n=2 Tax=Oncorhynchus mykiss TaxID=8022 RepID=A0A8C7PA38_ONCMY|nr:zinc finger protein 40 isoform X1 [Oncorhynchus mykiss]XP_021415771.2 zinc finger protein 40 isoform X1 [Oncorhynchus mykiss]XP_021415772.2 zinc finger protein 40 isoform X1 [Oncorhynchus mykiss]